jgi:hypothetical protein
LKLSDYLKKRNIPFDSIKALSVRQPFASQIVMGDKTIEWRSKPFTYRGPLVICASANPKIYWDNGKLLPAGAVVGVVDIVDCRPFTKADLYAACCDDALPPYDGYAWILDNPQECVPVPIKGIVAPWPYAQRGGPDVEFYHMWHEEHIIMGFE